MDETKVPRIQVRLMGDEESGNYSFTISESKFRLLEKAILEKNSIEPKQTEAGNDLGSLEVD
ncbi:hypothetical protein [Leptospira interrogans]|nr:hypothetical protein [Leptospira interrogans]UMQ52610.1 hypothetical protein FH582_01945 [Leptospira interrogans]UMQ56406.1 hypothetical protein FH582_22000 [Leptospira interrogans]UMQ56471.1 hypothetical protein FH582_21885 [Leptospira interrogans]